MRQLGQMKKSTKNSLFTYTLVIAAFVVVQALRMGPGVGAMLEGQLIPICAYIVMALALNLVVGVSGELSLGHAGFMSIGAFAGSALALALQSTVTLSPLRLALAMVFGAVIAAALGFLIGIPVLRLNGDYLAIVTLAFGEIIRSVVTNLTITGGAGGLKKIPKDSTYTIVFIVAVITVVIISNLVKSRHGRAICAIRDNVIAAESAGINVVYYKLLAFTVAAFFAGVAGVLYGHNLGILKPDTFDFNKSIEILVIVVLGGMGSIRGSILSAIIVTVLPEVLRGMEDYRMLAYAIVLIVIMLLNASPRFAALKNKLIHKSGKKAKKGEVA